MTGYALTMAVMVVVGLGSMSALERNSETFLEDTGTAIGEPRPSAEYLAQQGQLASLPAGLNYSNSNGDLSNPNNPNTNGSTSTTTPTTTPTTAAPTTAPPTTAAPTTAPPTTAAPVLTTADTGEFVTVDAGGNEWCMTSSGSKIVSASCSSSSPDFTKQTDGNGNTFLGLAGQCFSRSGDLSGADAVDLVTCDGNDDSQKWTQIGKYYKDPTSDRCLDVEGGHGAGNKLITWPCPSGYAGKPNQEFDFGATPTTPPPVLSGSNNFGGYSMTDNYDAASAANGPTSGPIVLTSAGAGTYTILLDGVVTGGGSDNSFFVSVNGGPLQTWHLTEGLNGSSVGGTNAPANGTITLAEGESVTIEVFFRESGTSMTGVQIVGP